MTKPLETPKELAERVGLPVTNIRYLIREDMLDHIYTAPGRRNPKIPQGAVVRSQMRQRKDDLSGANYGGRWHGCVRSPVLGDRQWEVRRFKDLMGVAHTSKKMIIKYAGEARQVMRARQAAAKRK